MYCWINNTDKIFIYIMTTFTADVVNNEIIINSSYGIPKKIPIDSLYLNNGTNVGTNVDEFEKDQQKVNYLDSIKDGTNVITMQGLNIYPLAGSDMYPTFPNDLKSYETAIIKARSSYLKHTAWLKVKKGSVLDPGKNYSKCLWESGLGYNVFLNNPNDVDTVKTFGSYIDPLEKQSAKSVWPQIGSTITLTPMFMKMMGFGDQSYVTSRTVTNSTFNYTMNVGCGQDCGVSQNSCIIRHDASQIDPNLVYFAGNNQKKQFLKTSASTSEKVKTIVVKEWGDKIQVLIYLVYYHCLANTQTIVMTTCDMVVFMLCLNLSIPCIYTGAYNPPGSNQDPNKKYYSILEFAPSDTPFTDARNRLISKINSIIAENESFMTAISNLTTDAGANTRISVGDNMLTFKKEFYILILEDLVTIHSGLQIYGQQLITSYNQYNEGNGSRMIPEIEFQIKFIQSTYIIVPFLKQKKGMTGASNILTILMTKSYTATKPVNNSKPSIKTYFTTNGMDESRAEKESKKSFYEIASSPANGFLVSRGGTGQYGGSYEEEIINLFPQDDDDEINASFINADGITVNIPKYIYKTNGEIENDGASGSYNNSYLDAPIFNAEISEVPQDINLLSELNFSFSQTIDPFLSSLPANFKETIYTLFVYESYINGCGTYMFDQTDLKRIINDYELIGDNDAGTLNTGQGIVENSQYTDGIMRNYISSPPSSPSIKKSFKKSLDVEKKKDDRVKGSINERKTQRRALFNDYRNIDEEPWMENNLNMPISSYGGKVNLKRRKTMRKTKITRKKQVKNKRIVKRHTKRNNK